MQSKPIYPKIWADDYFNNLEVDEKLLFIYYITNQRSTIIFVYECPDRVASFETGIARERVVEIRDKLDKDKKVRSYREYVYLVNSHRYEKYEGVNSDKAKYASFQRLPDDVKVWLTGIGYPPLIPPSTSP